MGAHVANMELPVNDPSLLSRLYNAAHENVGMKAVALGTAVLVGTAAIAGCDPFGSGKKSGTTKTHADIFNVEQVCTTPQIDLENTAFSYTNGHLLPAAPKNSIEGESGTNDNDKAAAYVQSWFSKTGPLAGKADRASLAALDAVLAHPATETSITNNYSIPEQFDQDMAKLEVPSTAASQAKDLCEAEATVSGTTFAYNSKNAIPHGAQYTQVTGIYGKVAGQSDVASIKLQPHTASADYAGVTFEVQNDNKKNADYNGFDEVVVQGDGEIDILGQKPNPNTSPSATSSDSAEPSTSPTANSSEASKSRATGGSTGTSGAGTGPGSSTGKGPGKTGPGTSTGPGKGSGTGSGTGPGKGTSPTAGPSTLPSTSSPTTAGPTAPDSSKSAEPSQSTSCDPFDPSCHPSSN